jgi:streptogramin lyase
MMRARFGWLLRFGLTVDSFCERTIHGARGRAACRVALATVLLVGVLPSANAIAAEGVKYVPPGSEIPTNEAWTPCAPATKGHAECELIVAPPKAAEVEGYKLEGSGPGGGFTAGELRSAYKLPEHGGKGNIVAIVDGEGDPHAEADLKEYRKEYSLGECTEANECFKQLNEKGEPHKPTSTGWSDEISLDLDMVSAACPECHIVLLEAANEERGLLEADETAVKKVGAAAVTNSWNLGFEANNPADKTHCETDKLFCVSQKEEEEDDPFLDHPGTPILFSGGDYGYAVRYPAVSQYAISVGGTALKKESNSRGWTEEVWSNSSYGDDQKGRGTGSGCSVYEPKPKFESEYSFDKPCTKNIENDVSADAAPETGVEVYDSYEGGWAVYGGTSASSPFVAGVEGLSTSHSRSLGAEAFWLAGGKGSLFDVTKGSNGTCTPPTEDEYWCTAKTGYDGPTGNGTPDGALALGGVPIATTKPATGITDTGATLNGTVNPEGGATKYYFQYGTTTSYGKTTTEESAGSGTSSLEESATITGLAEDTKYHFRIVATNGSETSYGSDQVFSTKPEFVEYGLPAGSEPAGIAAGPDGNLWVAQSGSTKVSKVTTGGVVTEYKLKSPFECPYGIAAGPEKENDLWFTDVCDHQVGKISTGGSSTAYSLPAGVALRGIVAGPDGNLWFDMREAGKIGKITTSGAISEYALPSGSGPEGIAVGPDGNLWFTNSGTSKIGKITTGGTITEYALPSGSIPIGIAAGPDGNLWFTDWGTSKIGKITTSGTVTEYPLPDGSQPRGIAAGPNESNSLWFTDTATSKIGEITTSGTITEYGLPSSSEPYGIALGPDGNMWFTDYGSGKVGKIVTAP